MRDLGRRPEALQLGDQAHELQPQDFRPCTLLGAVHMELGDFDSGREWYAKAAERGASEHSIDTELRSIFQRADKASRAAMKIFLLAEDPKRYRWVNDKRYPVSYTHLDVYKRQAYITALDPAFVASQQIAQAEYQAKEAQRLAREAEYLRSRAALSAASGRNPKNDKSSFGEVSIPAGEFHKADSEAQRRHRCQREREASEAVLKAQRVREAELAD